MGHMHASNDWPLIFHFPWHLAHTGGECGYSECNAFTILVQDIFSSEIEKAAKLPLPFVFHGKTARPPALRASA